MLTQCRYQSRITLPTVSCPAGIDQVSRIFDVNTFFAISSFLTVSSSPQTFVHPELEIDLSSHIEELAYEVGSRVIPMAICMDASADFSVFVTGKKPWLFLWQALLAAPVLAYCKCGCFAVLGECSVNTSLPNVVKYPLLIFSLCLPFHALFLFSPDVLPESDAEDVTNPPSLRHHTHVTFGSIDREEVFARSRVECVCVCFVCGCDHSFCASLS